MSPSLRTHLKPKRLSYKQARTKRAQCPSVSEAHPDESNTTKGESMNSNLTKHQSLLALCTLPNGIIDLPKYADLLRWNPSCAFDRTRSTKKRILTDKERIKLNQKNAR